MTCASCGAENEQVEPVRRKYLLQRADGGVPSEQVLDEIEEWCFACRTHYPYDPAT